jgi:hypothetical protein
MRLIPLGRRIISCARPAIARLVICNKGLVARVVPKFFHCRLPNEFLAFFTLRFAFVFEEIALDIEVEILVRSN